MSDFASLSHSRPDAPRIAVVALVLLAFAGVFAAPVVVLPLLGAAGIVVTTRRTVVGRTRTVIVLLVASLVSCFIWLVLQVAAVGVIAPRAPSWGAWDVAAATFGVATFGLVIAALAVGARGLALQTGQPTVVWAAWACAVVWLLSAGAFWALWGRVLDLEDAGRDATGVVGIMLPVVLVGVVALVLGAVGAVILAVRPDPASRIVPPPPPGAAVASGTSEG